MKKFYENPVVEITVFDVKDICTASDVNVGYGASDRAKTAVINAINDFNATSTDTKYVGIEYGGGITTGGGVYPW